MERNYIMGNKAYDGGGLYLKKCFSLHVMQLIQYGDKIDIKGNVAENKGGGIFLLMHYSNER